MKSGLAWILGLSLTVNGVLLAARWRSDATSGAAPSAGPVALLAPADADETRSSAGAGGLPGAAAGSVSADIRPARPGSLWARLDLGDLTSVVATLRAAGVPERDLRTVVEALVRDRFKARIEAAQAGETNQPFWRTRSSNSAASQRFSESYAIWREVEAMTMDLLGPEPLDPLAAYSLRQRFGSLSDEKLQAIIRLDRDYGDLSMQARSSSLGPMMPWEREQLAFVEAEKRKDIEALLSPAELEIYDLHSSSAATSLRTQLAGFAPTEAEFRAIFAMQRAFDAQFGTSRVTMSTEASRAMQAARPRLNEQIKAYLGEARYKDYERSTDAGYQAALGVTKRLNLPAENATAAYTLAQETRARVKELNRTAELSASERSRAIGALVDQANARLDSLLTGPGAAAYKMRSSEWRSVESERRQP